MLAHFRPLLFLIGALTRFGKWFVKQHERRFGEIVRICYGTPDVHYHEFVVHELMLTVIPYSDAMFPQAMALRTSCFPLITVQYDPHLDISLSSADESIGNGFACECICRNAHGLLRT